MRDRRESRTAIEENIHKTEYQPPNSDIIHDIELNYILTVRNN